MAEFSPLWAGGPLFAQAEHFRLSTDSILLADFVRVGSCRRGIDLGCASGILGLLLLTKNVKLQMTGIELVPEAAALADENFDRNNLSDRAEVICGDLREHRGLFPSGSFDLVVANPPYYPAAAGAVSPDACRAGARSEVTCTLEDVCSAARYLCRTGGKFCLVGKPERLSEVMNAMVQCGFEPKRLRFAASGPGKAPSLFLLEGIRGGGVGLAVEPELFLCNEDGSESEEYRRIYHR